MKRNFYTLLSAYLLCLAPSFAQERVLDKSNMREGESVEYCVTHKKMAELRNDPKTAALLDAAEQEQVNQLKSKGENSTTKGTVYKIPVVFHILHNNGPENISREQVLDAVAILNRDYRKLNADANNVQTPFQGMPTDVEIEFQLATKDPVGNCFSGITRTVTTVTDGQAQVNAIISGNNVYQGVWPHSKYLNIIVAADVGGAAGYTMKPFSTSTASAQNMRYNSIYILHTYTGSIGTSNLTSSRALTHEVGHWLNLDHTWGPNNNPGNAASCNDDDAVQDTPMCIGVTQCSLSSNTCNDTNDPNNYSSWTTDVVDNVENYMDYSYCSKMFTQGQVTRMRNALTSSTAGRNMLITASNHLATGINSAPTLCKAEFAAERTTICVGETIQFTDQSYNAATGWNWTFTGGSPATSTSQNPSVTYTTAGTYAVQLTATDGSSSNTKNMTGYITVVENASGLPFFEGFETSTSLTSPKWFVTNPNGNGWAITNTTGATGSKSVKLSSYGQTANSVDELESGSFDLSPVTAATGVTLTFKCAFRKRLSNNSDKLQVQSSNNCGQTWSVRKTFSANTLSNYLINNTDWTPVSSDFITHHITNITSSDWVEKFKFKFVFTSGSGNNVYIDDINLYGGGPSDSPVLVGIAELDNIQGVSLYPNPAEDDLQLVFDSKTGDNQVFVEITDLYGKTIQKHLVKANEGTNVVMMTTSDLSAGTYMVRLSTSSGQKILKFIKK